MGVKRSYVPSRGCIGRGEERYVFMYTRRLLSLTHHSFTVMVKMAEIGSGECSFAIALGAKEGHVLCSSIHIPICPI